MNELALGLPALLLALFCLVYSIAARRELYSPLPKGLWAKLRSPHAVFLALLSALILAAGASAAEAAGDRTRSGRRAGPSGA